jgi:hypothetical protein
MSAAPLFPFLILVSCICLTVVTIFTFLIGIELWLVLRRANQTLPQLQDCAREGERCLRQLRHILGSGARMGRSAEAIVVAGCDQILNIVNTVKVINEIAHTLIGGRLSNGHHSSEGARVTNGKKQPQGRSNHGTGSR